MRTRQLGKSDLQITPVGFGAWAAGGGGVAHGWGDQDDAATLRAMARAVDHGINWIDTAPAYGCGHSEEVVGNFLSDLGEAGRPYVFTKCSLVWDAQRTMGHDLSAASLQRELEDSLRRLRVEAIDLYQIHWPAYKGGSDAGIEGAFTALAQMQQAGKVRYLGVSNFSVEQMQRVAGIAPITSLQPPYSAVRRDAEKELLPYCLKNEIGVINYSPMEAGLLSGAMTRERVEAFPEDDWRKRGAQFQEPALTRNLALADTIAAVAEAHHVSAAAVAIAWTLKNPAITAAIVGARSPEQVDGFVAAAKVKLTAADLEKIAAV